MRNCRTWEINDRSCKIYGLCIIDHDLR
ncbi:unnamed protein product [Spirodela intermedia]|uniref:Uncharacterized protein n=1 Tax=Spirodela intermedia TaxID=51605 RepID=A0A7I8LK19_SPIIN|nr:unnamed protein product [Spirodela intermedia]